MKQIPISKGRFVLIDDEDFELATKHSWCFDIKKSGNGYAAATIKQKKTYLHRLLMNAKSGEHIDHKNGNPLDCRRENMRICTNKQNSSNQKTKKSFSGFKGVSPAKKGRWSTYITNDYKTKWLGFSATKYLAAQAYDLAALKTFGEFAKPNLACSKILYKAIQLENGNAVNRIK